MVDAQAGEYTPCKMFVTVGPGRNDRRPGDKGLSTKGFCLSTRRVVRRRPEIETSRMVNDR